VHSRHIRDHIGAFYAFGAPLFSSLVQSIQIVIMNSYCTTLEKCLNKIIKNRVPQYYVDILL